MEVTSDQTITATKISLTGGLEENPNIRIISQGIYRFDIKNGFDKVVRTKCTFKVTQHYHPASWIERIFYDKKDITYSINFDFDPAIAYPSPKYGNDATYSLSTSLYTSHYLKSLGFLERRDEDLNSAILSGEIDILTLAQYHAKCIVMEGRRDNNTVEKRRQLKEEMFDENILFMHSYIDMYDEPMESLNCKELWESYNKELPNTWYSSIYTMTTHYVNSYEAGYLPIIEFEYSKLQYGEYKRRWSFSLAGLNFKLVKNLDYKKCSNQNDDEIEYFRFKVSRLYGIQFEIRNIFGKHDTKTFSIPQPKFFGRKIF